jgi:hypothetical protein
VLRRINTAAWFTAVPKVRICFPPAAGCKPSVPLDAEWVNLAERI